MDELTMDEMHYGRLHEGYADDFALMEDILFCIDLRIYLFYNHHQWLGPGNDMKNMLGIVVSREEFEHKLSKASEQGLFLQLNEAEREQVALREAALRERLEHTKVQLRLVQLIARFALDEFESACLCLAYAAAIDGKYEKLLAYLQDDITKKRPSTALAAQLFLPEGVRMEACIARFEGDTPFTSLFDAVALQNGELHIKPMVTAFLRTGALGLPRGLTFFDGAEDAPEHDLLIDMESAHALAAAAELSGAVVNLVGQEGSGRRFQLQHALRQQKGRCLFADLNVLGQEEAAFAEASLVSHLLDAGLCFSGLEKKAQDGEADISETLLDGLLHARRCRGPLYLLSKKPLHLPGEGLLVSHVMPETDSAARLALFTYFLKDLPLEEDISLQELAAKFRFVPRQVRRAAEAAAGQLRLSEKKTLDNETLHRCCYAQVVHKLDSLAVRIRPGYGWDDLVLPEEQKMMMQNACAHVRFQHQIYNDWGFGAKLSYGRGLSMLFAGVPGTGKTMCAQIIAKQLNMEMYKINISQIVSKYIGETEKNLGALFQEARDSNCILFFDECDALFGKRSDVKDSHDRHANVEVAYLLQQIEEHDGVCILASNLTQNMDAAFMRRITYVVHFPFPDPAARREIYLRMLPRAAPASTDIDWEFLAEKFRLSGGHIKNIMLASAFMAAAEGLPISMRHLLQSAVNEMKKNEIVVVREDLREYADLLFDGGGSL